MMIHRSTGFLMAGASILLAGHSQADVTRVPKMINNSSNQTYTAYGSTDYKTALMIKYLLKNPHLRVNAFVGNLQTDNHLNKSDRLKQNSDFNISYTIKGTTTKEAALQLKQLFETGKKISIATEIRTPEENISHNTHTQYVELKKYSIHFPEFTPFYYRGLPPTYTNGKMLWLPISLEKNKLFPIKE